MVESLLLCESVDVLGLSGAGVLGSAVNTEAELPGVKREAKGSGFKLNRRERKRWEEKGLRWEGSIFSSNGLITEGSN